MQSESWYELVNHSYIEVRQTGYIAVGDEGNVGDNLRWGLTKVKTWASSLEVFTE